MFEIESTFSQMHATASEESAAFTASLRKQLDATAADLSQMRDRVTGAGRRIVAVLW